MCRRRTAIRSACAASRRDDYAYAVSESWEPLKPLLESGGALALDDGELENYHMAALELERLRRRGASLRAGLGVA